MFGLMRLHHGYPFRTLIPLAALHFASLYFYKAQKGGGAQDGLVWERNIRTVELRPRGFSLICLLALADGHVAMG